MKNLKYIFVLIVLTSLAAACSDSSNSADTSNSVESCTENSCKNSSILKECHDGIVTLRSCPAGCHAQEARCNYEAVPDVCTKDLCKDSNTLLVCQPDGAMNPQTCPYGCDASSNTCKSQNNNNNNNSNNNNLPDQLTTQTIAPSYNALSGNALYDILGTNVVDGGVNFAVFAKNATRVEVLIFDSANPNAHPIHRLPMSQDAESGIWTLFAKDLGDGTSYGYIAFGPNWPYSENFKPGTTEGYISDCDVNGNRYNPNKLLIDPYTRRTNGEFNWQTGNPLSGAGRAECDWAQAPKSVVVASSNYTWSTHEATWRENRQKGDAFTGHAVNDLIIYEVQPKGFTMAASNVAHPGTWRGIGENAQYLANLGVTAVEFLPVAEKNADGTYWGYDTIAFFAPEQQYATSESHASPSGILDEFKEMVDKLHQAGIEVILDVVYGQTGEGGFWTEKIKGSDYIYSKMTGDDDDSALPIYSFRGLDNKEYYHLVGSDNKYYLNQTGVGNQTRANYGPFHRLILDNIHFWAEEMHVDGFRFDLASVLGVADDQITTNGDSHEFDNAYWMKNAKNTIVQEIIDDEMMKKYNTRIIAEPWSAVQFALGGFTASTADSKYAWSEWNGRFRDLIKSIVNYDDVPFNGTDTFPPNWDLIDIGNILTGSSKLFQDEGRRPYNSINYITAHDGFTIYDAVTYANKHNECGKLNPICCDYTSLPFCSLNSGPDDNKSRNWCLSETLPDPELASPDSVLTADGKCPSDADEIKKREVIRALFSLLLLSPGTPMILGGDEYLRTLYGNNNSFSNGADNEYNWMRWAEWEADPARLKMHHFVRDLIAIRKQYNNLLSPKDYDLGPTKWIAPNGVTEADLWSGRAMGVYYQGSPNSIFIMINLESDQNRTFAFPESGEWKVLVDTQSYFETDSNWGTNTWLDGSRPVSGSYELKPRSVVVVGK